VVNAIMGGNRLLLLLLVHIVLFLLHLLLFLLLLASASLRGDVWPNALHSWTRHCSCCLLLMLLVLQPLFMLCLIPHS
jgi:hypothetical protein